MAIYYSDKLTLGESTTLYTDIALTIPAENGYYSSDDIVREQVYGTLISGSSTCIPICPPPAYAVLTLKAYDINASNSNFRFELTNNTLPFNITISNITVNTYSNQYYCVTSGATEYTDTCGACVLLLGTGAIVGNGLTPPPCTLYGRYYHVVDSIDLTIGATTYPLNNGDKLTIGGYDIFIQLYDFCFPLQAIC